MFRIQAIVINLISDIRITFPDHFFSIFEKSNIEEFINNR